MGVRMSSCHFAIVSALALRLGHLRFNQHTKPHKYATNLIWYSCPAAIEHDPEPADTGWPSCVAVRIDGVTSWLRGVFRARPSKLGRLVKGRPFFPLLAVRFASEPP